MLLFPFWTGSHFVALGWNCTTSVGQVGFELVAILLLLPPKCSYFVLRPRF